MSTDSATGRSASWRGLTTSEAEERRREHGSNEVPEDGSGPVRATLRRMWNPTAWLLEAAMVFEIVLGRGVQAAFVLLLLVFSAVTGEVQSIRAARAVGELRDRLQVRARVLRDGRWTVLAAREIVPGDVVRVSVGEVVPADLAIREGSVEADESSVTGESGPVRRGAGDLLTGGPAVRHGEATGIVSATGAASSLGRNADLVRRSDPPGRLQALLFTVVHLLAMLDAVLIAVLVGTAVVRGEPWRDLAPYIAVLIIATVPISMPSSFTVANSVEARALVDRGVLTAGLSGIQEAGAMDVLLVDKTGTLTRNEPMITGVECFEGAIREDVLSMAASATDSQAADAVSAAVMSAARAARVVPPDRTAFTGFDPSIGISRAVVAQGRRPGGLTVLLGAPGAVARRSDVPPGCLERVRNLSSRGSRVVLVAWGPAGGVRVRGLLVLGDEPREDAASALEKIRQRGVRIVMVTGDGAPSARAIAARVGIGSRIGTSEDAVAHPEAFDVLAQVRPEDKHRVVMILQGQGHVVGMTGDGVNDAPALKQADVGIAVRSAADAAKSASRLILTREGLEPVADLVDSGHRVYARMMTWTVTKLARTAELALLLVLGYLLNGFFPVSLTLIVMIVVLNDLVTLALGTDRAGASSVPERWSVRGLAGRSAALAAAWTAVGGALLGVAVHVCGLAAGQVGSVMFAYVMFSAMATILVTRTRGALWRSAPSRWVGGTVAGNCIIAAAVAAEGVFTTAIGWPAVGVILAVTAVTVVAIDAVGTRLAQ